MSVYITDDELATFAKNGFDRNAVKRTVDAYRSQGMSDSDIRAKVDMRLADWNDQPATQITSQPAPQTKQEGVMEGVQRLLDATARGIPLLGGLYNKYNAASDASANYLWGKLGVKHPDFQNPDGTSMSWREMYNRFLQKENEKQARDTANFPLQTLGANLVGGIGSGIGVNAAKNVATNAGKGLSAQIANALKTSVPLAAVDAGIRADGDMYDRLYASARGGAIASVLTPPLVTAGYGVSKGIDWAANKIAQAKLNNAINKPVEQITTAQKHVLKQALGSEARVNAVLEEAKKQGKTLAELGNENINRVIMKAEMASPSARTTISDYKEKFDSELPQKFNKVLNEKVSTESGVKTIDEMGDFFSEQARPYYQSAYKTKVPSDTMVKLNQNMIINNAAKKVDADYANVFGGRSKVKVDDLQYWDGVKSKLDHMISAETNSAAPDGRKIANLMDAKSELTGALDALNPNYKIARDISSNSFDIKRAYNMAGKALRADMTPDKFKTAIGEMTPAEQNAVKIGVRDTLSGMFGKTQDPTSSFGKLLPPNAQQNLKLLLGEKNGQDLIDFAKNVHNVSKALYAAKGNSLTGARVTMADEAAGIAGDVSKIKSLGSAATLPARWIAKTAVNKSNDKLYNQLAEYILTGKNPAITPIPVRTTPSKVGQVLQALGKNVSKTKALTPYIQTLPITTVGVTNDRELLKALGY